MRRIKINKIFKLNILQLGFKMLARAEKVELKYRFGEIAA